MTHVAPINQSDFSASAAVEGSTTLALSLQGNADIHIIEPLKNFLQAAHQEALRLSVSEVTIDMKQLEFMNSSCFKNFVSWLNSVQELAPEKQYKIKFLSNPAMHWQKRSLHALRCFAVELITIEA
jgi:hypothetical protein